MRVVTLLLIIFYPIVTHFSVAIGDPKPSLLLLLIGVLMICVGLIHNHKYLSSAYTLFGALGVYFTAKFSFTDPFTILYIPPLIVSVFLVWLFGRSLIGDRLSIISEVAKAYHGELPPQLAIYTRRLTLTWAVYFALFAISVFYLGFVSQGSRWSFYINLVNYVIIATLLVGEYLLRISLFKDLEHPSFIGFIRLLNNAKLYMPFYNR